MVLIFQNASESPEGLFLSQMASPTHTGSDLVEFPILMVARWCWCCWPEGYRVRSITLEFSLSLKSFVEPQSPCLVTSSSLDLGPNLSWPNQKDMTQGLAWFYFKIPAGSLWDLYLKTALLSTLKKTKFSILSRTQWLNYCYCLNASPRFGLNSLSPCPTHQHLPSCPVAPILRS